MHRAFFLVPMAHLVSTFDQSWRGRSHDAMALTESSGFAHVRLTVTDITRSKSFYDLVFGRLIAIDASGQVGEPGIENSPVNFYGGTVCRTPHGTRIGLRPVGKEISDSEHSGRDHVCFAVASCADLDRAAANLTQGGVQHRQIIDLAGTGIATLSVQDSDNSYSDPNRLTVSYPCWLFRFFARSCRCPQLQ